MFPFTKNYCIDLTRPGYRPINFDINRIILSLLMLLWLIPASAVPASALLNGIIQESASKPVPDQSQINPATLIDEIKLKLAATTAELALLPSEAIAGSAAAGLPGQVDIFARRLRPATRV
jgi:hypothetical protein